MNGQPRVACLMVIGAGESRRHLDRVLRLAGAWADVLLVHADGCDVDTLDAIDYAAERHEQVVGDAFVSVALESGYLASESGVRNRALELCDAHLTDGDLVVALDADEILEAHGSAVGVGVPLATAAKDRRYDAWLVQFVHAWAPDESVIRVDGGWRPDWGRRIYRHRKGQRIPDKKLACQPVPAGVQESATCPRDLSPFRVNHLGYAYPHDREAKSAFYLAVDGGRYHSSAHLRSILETPELAPMP